MRNKCFLFILMLLIVMATFGCQIKHSDLSPPMITRENADESAGIRTMDPDNPDINPIMTPVNMMGLKSTNLYYIPKSAEDFSEYASTPNVSYVSDPSIYIINDGFLSAIYPSIFQRGPKNWQGQSYQPYVLPDKTMGEIACLVQQFVFAVDDMQTPGFIMPAGSGLWKLGSYTSQDIKEIQRNWQQQIFTEDLYHSLLDYGQEISLIPTMIEGNISASFNFMFIAVNNTIIIHSSHTQTEQYAVPVVLMNYMYSSLANDAGFMYKAFRYYMSTYPDRRLMNNSLGHVVQWVFIKRQDNGKFMVTGWETNFLFNGVADAVIYDETGVRTAWFDRTEGMLDGYDMTTLDFHEEEILTRRLYDKGVDFIMEMYTLKGADMADTGFDAARAMMAGELISAMNEDGFFDEYLMNIQNQDIRMTPYFAPDPMDDRITPYVEVYTQQPMQCLARLTKPGAPDLWQITFKWNFEDFSTNVEGAWVTWEYPLETMDMTRQDGAVTGAGWRDEVRTGSGFLAILTFVEQDGQLQVVNWHTRGR